MKLKHLFATLSLAIVAGAGVTAGVSSGNAQKASAANEITSFYIDASVDGTNNYEYFCHCWNSNTDSADYHAVKVDGTSSLFSVTTSKSFANYIIVAMPEGSKSLNWDTKVYQTGDLTIATSSDDKDTSVLYSYEGNHTAHWAKREASVADGYYLRGVYHGVASWDSNVI